MNFWASGLLCLCRVGALSPSHPGAEELNMVMNLFLDMVGLARPSGQWSDAALALVDRVANQLAAADRELLTRLEPHLDANVAPAIVSADALGASLARLERQLTGATNAERRLLAMLAYRRVRSVGPAPLAADLADRALAGGRLLDDEIGSPALFAAGIVLGLSGRTETAEDLFGEIARRAESAHSVAVGCAAHGQRGVERYRRGALPQARVDLERALELARGELWEGMVDDRRAHLLRVHGERGAFDIAERLLHAWGAVGPLPETTLGNQLLVERGRLRLAQGRFGEALADLRSAKQRLREPGDSVLFEWRRPAALAHDRVGDHDAALQIAATDLEIASTWGAPRHVGSATATLGLIERGESGIELLAEAVRIFEDSPARLEHARASIDLGAALRRAGQPSVAREHLRRGLELAVRCGSHRLADVALQEMAATGIKRRRRAFLSGTDALTPTERRVARLAIDGLSNPEIGRTLFVTRKTVEMHLSSVYRKLGIRSRGELRSALEFAA
jgi:DNA-binding CsgD family transcriptional regulator